MSMRPTRRVNDEENIKKRGKRSGKQLKRSSLRRTGRQSSNNSVQHSDEGPSSIVSKRRNCLCPDSVETSLKDTVRLEDKDGGFEIRHFPVRDNGLSGSKEKSTPVIITRETRNHPLLVGDFTRAAVILEELGKKGRAGGGIAAADSPHPETEDEERSPRSPSRSPVPGAPAPRRTDETDEDLIPRTPPTTDEEGLMRTPKTPSRRFTDEEEERIARELSVPRSNADEPERLVIETTPGGISVVRETEGEEGGPGFLRRDTTDQLSRRGTEDDPGGGFSRRTVEEVSVAPASRRDTADDPGAGGGFRRSTRHDTLGASSVQPGDESRGPSRRPFSRGGGSKAASAPRSRRGDDELVGGEENEVGGEAESALDGWSWEEREALDHEQPPDEEGGSAKRSEPPPPEPVNRDVLFMSILLVLATPYAWNMVQACTTELKFALPNVYGKRGLMAPWYLGTLLKGLLSLVKLGELYDNADHVETLDRWTTIFLETFAITLMTGEIQCEVLMPGVPTSPAFWLFLGSVPFFIKFSSDGSERESVFSRYPLYNLGSIMFLQFLMAITAKRWLMMFNTVLLGLLFFDHDIHFNSDSYLYMTLLNLLYAIGIDRSLHGGQCPPVSPACNRCG